MEGLLVLAVLAACPLIMWLMMRGMGKQADQRQQPDGNEREAEVRAKIASLREQIAMRRSEGDESHGTRI